MISFVLTVIRLLRAIVRSWEVPFFRAALALAAVLLLSGALFFMSVEGWAFPDALLFAMPCLSPLGDGGLHPQTAFGKIFAVLYAFVGIGLFVALSPSWHVRC
jgi:voltage-gated potassium channel